MLLGALATIVTLLATGLLLIAGYLLVLTVAALFGPRISPPPDRPHAASPSWYRPTMSSSSSDGW